MNKCIFIGRLTADPEVKYSQGAEPLAIARYSLAVKRSGKIPEGQPDVDFFRCVAFGKLGEFAEKHLKKGVKIAVEAHAQNNNYTGKDGTKVYSDEYVIEKQEFVEKKAETTQAAQEPASAPAPQPVAQQAQVAQPQSQPASAPAPQPVAQPTIDPNNLGFF